MARRSECQNLISSNLKLSKSKTEFLFIKIYTYEALQELFGQHGGKVGRLTATNPEFGSSVEFAGFFGFHVGDVVIQYGNSYAF